MTDITEFSERAATQFLESQHDIQERFNLGLARRAVEEFVKAVFFASLLPDEGRYPTVCLMSYRKGCQTGFHFLFNVPLPPIPQEIAKLAHAVAPGSHLCCLCDEGQISLAGIHVTKLNEMREFGYTSSRVPNPLKLIIRGPGHIEMSTGGIATIYKAGNITAENVFQYCRVIRALAAAVKDELAELTEGTVEALDDIFNDLAKAIVRLNHGGILIVAKNPQGPQFSSLRQIDCLFLQQLLVRYWDDVATCVALSGGVGNVLAGVEAGMVNPHALAVASDAAMLENCIESIAHLAGVDGAIVLTYDCKLAAFNAILAKSVPGADSCRLVDQHDIERPRDLILGHRASRHQAALSYAVNVPDCFTFVISQDGGISAFHNAGDGRVICEVGMRVLD